MKANWQMIGITLLVFLLFGTCTYIDYRVHKTMYPNSGCASYMWHSCTSGGHKK